MGAYSSRIDCQSHYHLDINCTQEWNNQTKPPTLLAAGGVHRGKFEGDPDIAGIGVFYAFFSVSAIALLTSLVYLGVQLEKYAKLPKDGVLHDIQEHRRAKDRIKGRVGWSETFERIILSCSDQQIFTSGAYAIVLRYSKGCAISAYHYNIVGNMLLMTCATHLMSVTGVTEYCKDWMVAALRVLLVSAFYIVTGLLLANQNVDDSPGAEDFPTAVPPSNTNNTLMVLPAVCFQPDTGLLGETFNQTFGSGEAAFGKTILTSTPKNHIQGWNFFVLMILWYGLAMAVEIIRLVYRHRNSQAMAEGRKGRIMQWAYWAFWFYQFGGVVFCTVAIIYSFIYIRDLRGWMNASGWLALDHGGNPENDPTTFGQLVPLLLILLTVFVILQQFSEKWHEYRHRRRGEQNAASPDQEGLQSSPPDGNILYSSVPSLPPEKQNGKTDGVTVNVNSVPPTPAANQGMDIRPMYPSPTPTQTNSQWMLTPTGSPPNPQSPLRPQPSPFVAQSPTPSYHTHAPTANDQSPPSATRPRFSQGPVYGPETHT